MRNAHADEGCNGAADKDVVDLLVALCAAEAGTRCTAEQALDSVKLLPGFAARLANFAISNSQVLALRQMALTVLKQVIKQHWSQLSTEDQGFVMQLVVVGVATESRAVRGLLHACAAGITTRRGFWPELQAQLAVGLSRGTSQEAFSCVECVGVLLEECKADVVVVLGPLQEPMLRLASSEDTPLKLRRACVDVHATIVAQALLGDGIDAVPGAVEGVKATLPNWLAVHGALCVGNEAWNDGDRVDCALTALRALTAVAKHGQLKSCIAEHILQLLQPACLLLQRLGPGYEATVIQADDDGKSDDEGGVAQLVAQVMEMVQAMLMSAKLRKLLHGHVQRILNLLAPFMRITEAQVRSWVDDPNLFLAQEEDEHVRGCVVRLSGEGLVGELLAHLRRETNRALAHLVCEMLDQGERDAARGQGSAWKFTEVALFLYGNAACGVSSKALQRSELGALLPRVLSTSAGLCTNKAVALFLRARAFALLKRLGDTLVSVIPKEIPALLETAAAALVPDQPLVVRVNACRAFCRFLTVEESVCCREKLLLDNGVLASLTSLLQESDEEVLHLALESLCIVVRLCPGTLAAAQESFASLVLDVWHSSVSDPLLRMQVMDLVSVSTASDPRLQSAMEERLLPAVAADLQSGMSEPHAASSAIELFGVLLKRTATPLSPRVVGCVELLLTTVMQSSQGATALRGEHATTVVDSSLLQQACVVLSSLVWRSAEQLAKQGLIASMLQCVERLLRTDLDDDACLYIGPLTQLFLHKFGRELPAEMLAGLLQALLGRFLRAELPDLQQDLLIIFARLLLQDLHGVLAALRSMQMACDEGRNKRSGLDLLLQKWLVSGGNIQARLARNVNISALCKLHSHCLEDPTLRQVCLEPLSGPQLRERILSAIVSGLEFENERCRRLRECRKLERHFDDDEEDEDGGNEPGDDEERCEGRLLSDLVDLDDVDSSYDGSAAGCDAFQEMERSDPIYGIDAQQVAAQYLAAHSASSGTPVELVQRIAAALGAARSNS